MRSSFDRRVLSEPQLEFVRACQRRADCHLGGGAALAGAFLSHRVSRDVDLFCHDAMEHRALVRQLNEAAREAGAALELQRDGGSFVRGSVSWPDARVLVDVVHEPQADLEPPPAPVDGIVVESLVDLRASKITCVLSRAEPRDLVDLYHLEQAGYPPERDLALAVQKDAGIDPGVLAWLIKDFPTEPLPEMLQPLTREALRLYRDELATRLRALAVGE